MLKALETFVLSLVVWEAVVTASVLIMYVMAGRTSIGPEGSRYLTLAGILGLLVVLLCWSVCRKLTRLASVLVGLGLGLTVPILAGFMAGKAADQWITDWGHYGTSLDLWIEGLQLSLPSGIAGAIIGLLQGRKAMHHSAEALN